MLKQLLNTPQQSTHKLYEYLPVSTSLEQQLKKEAAELMRNFTPSSRKANVKKHEDFVSNENPENIKSDLIMLKLKGYMDRTNLSGRNQEIKKLPSKVQVGRVIEGDPFLAIKAQSHGKIKNRKQEMSLTEYYLNLDKKESFSFRKFSEIQKTKQRSKKIRKPNGKFAKKGKK